MKITREMFEAYERVRESGATNMFAVGTVKRLMDEIYGLDASKDEILEIMKNYSKYDKKFNK
jgi:hypothetical protein